MKKSIVLSIIIAGIFATTQVLGQADVKSTEKKPASEQKKDPNATNTGKDGKTQTGGYTKSGATITVPTPAKTTEDKPGALKETPAVAGSKIFNRTGEIMATVDKDGTIRDAQGTTLGRYADNGDYFGPAGERIGTIKDGVIRNMEGKEAGRISKEGKVSNAKGKVLGTIGDDGTIRNSKGSKLGSAPGVNKNISAMIFFINKKKQSTEKKPKEQTQPGFEAKPIPK